MFVLVCMCLAFGLLIYWVKRFIVISRLLFAGKIVWKYLLHQSCLKNSILSLAYTNKFDSILKENKINLVTVINAILEFKILYIVRYNCVLFKSMKIRWHFSSVRKLFKYWIKYESTLRHCERQWMYLRKQTQKKHRFFEISSNQLSKRNVS